MLINTFVQGIVPSGSTVTNIHVIAGYGSSKNIKVAKILSKEYGSDYWRWQKKTGIVESSYSLYEVS